MVPSGRSHPRTRTQDPTCNSQMSGAFYEKTGGTHHCTNDSNSVGDEVLGEGQYDKKYSSCSCERTSAGPGQTGIRNEKKFTLTSHHEVGTSKVSEAGGADATPVRAV
jgi:hypothetical protein